MALTTITTGGNDQVTWQQSRWVYWIERDGIGIAKYNPVATRNNDEFTSPEDARDVYLYYYKKAAHYTLPSVNATTWESETHEMPSQFHQGEERHHVPWPSQLARPAKLYYHQSEHSDLTDHLRLSQL